MAALTVSPVMHPGEPLRKRAPEFDEEGKALSDFMMIFPGLRDAPSHHIQNVIGHLGAVMARYTDTVAFVELNLRLNLLWVSVKPVNGLRYEIAEAIREHVPNAKLVAHL